jgi:hypothetical protein
MTIDLDKLETLAKAAGGESWSTECGPAGTFDGMHVWGPDGDSVCRVFGNIGNWPEPIDESQIAAHIEANSPKAILELCAEVRRLRERLEIDDRHPYDGIHCRDVTIKTQDDIIESLQKDADRYRWMRRGMPLNVTVPVKDKEVHYFLGHKPEAKFPECLDAAIDAVIAKEKP